MVSKMGLSRDSLQIDVMTSLNDENINGRQDEEAMSE